MWIGGGIAAAAVLAVAVAGLVKASEPKEIAAPAPTEQPAASPPVGEGSPQAIILAQLQQAQVALAQQGYQLVGQPFSGGLVQGQSWNVPAELHYGFDYRVLGVCDRDCGDLDLVLYDTAGAALQQDTTVTSQPMLAVQPGYTGGYILQARMYDCRAAPCYYALALYARPIG